ncbi:MAG: site-2 protease family protein [Planctomycetaceae bacterium]
MLNEEGIVFATGWVSWLATPANWLLVLQVAAGLGFVIFVHELGHFLVAKACGVKCEKFFLGFDVGGLKLVSVRGGETEYGIGALPLGGYVKMLGQDDNPAAAAEEARRARAHRGGTETSTASAPRTEHASMVEAFAGGDLPAEPTAGPHPAWDPRSYPAHSVPERRAIISAGVVMNVVSGVMMAALALWLGVSESTCEISNVRPGGVAWRAGIRSGDKVVAIGSKKDPIFSDLQKGVTLGDVAAGIPFTIQRPSDGSTWQTILHPDTDLGPPAIGVSSPLSTVIPDRLDGEKASRLPGGLGRADPPLASGDRIVTVAGRNVERYDQIIAVVSEDPSRPVELVVDRVGDVFKTTLPPLPRRTLGLSMTMGPVTAVQDGSPAAEAGIQPGDRIESINGEPPGDPLALPERIASRVGESVTLAIARVASQQSAPAETLEVTMTPRRVDWIEEPLWPSTPVAISALGIAVAVDAVVASVEPDGPAERAGIKPGDTVEKALLFVGSKQDGPVSDEPLPFSQKERNWPHLDVVLQKARDDVRLILTVKDASGGTRDVELSPVESPDRFIVDRGLVFEPLKRMVRAGSLPAALSGGLSTTIDDLSMVGRFLKKLTSNQLSPRLLGGPIEIAKQAGRSAEEGFSRFLLFLTMLSANLAVVNFLPIPVLDGGHMVFLLYELIRGKPPSENVVAVLSYMGLALLLTLMIFVSGLDLGIISRR